jgi:hypothetical protein
MDDDEAFADNYAERDQAKALREQARAGGLRFEAYLTGDQADWLLERVERGMFVDPSEAVFAIVQNFRELEPHRDLRNELLGRMLDASAADLESARPMMRCLTSGASGTRNRVPNRRAGRRLHDEPARPPALAHAGAAGTDCGGRRRHAAALP